MWVVPMQNVCHDARVFANGTAVQLLWCSEWVLACCCVVAKVFWAVARALLTGFDISISYITALFVRVSRSTVWMKHQVLVVSVNKSTSHAAVSLWCCVIFLCDWQSCGLGRRSQLMFDSLLGFLLHLMTRFPADVPALTKPRPGQNQAISAHW